MEQYRDYGKLNNQGASPALIQTDNRTQVYKATHDGVGNRLPYMNRSFISFSYGGRYIEDFNFVATISNNAMTGKIYADFQDNITETDVYDGQIYWSSHFNSNTISFSLATDGITEQQYDDFKAWFIPGKIRELILMERPNRAILARVSEVPQYNLLPFEEKITVKVMGQSYETSTTMYKGGITLTLVMDDPFWYSKMNVLVAPSGTDSFVSDSKWIDANGQEVEVTSDKDALKIVAEDHIPVLNQTLSDDGSDPISIGNATYVAYKEKTAQGSYVGSAAIDSGHIAYVFKASNEKIGYDDVSENNPFYFFYGGNAPCYPIIHFKLTPILEENGYITVPKNSIAAGQEQFNTITIKSKTEKKLLFALPSFWQGYNQVIKLFKQLQEDCPSSIDTSESSLSDEEQISYSSEDVRQLIRETVKHYGPRIFAIEAINNYAQSGGEAGNVKNFVKGDFDTLIDEMQNLLKVNNALAQAEFTIDNKFGKVTAKFEIPDSTNTSKIITEDASDMIKSSYLSIEEQNTFDEEGYLQRWSAEHPEYGHVLTSDVEGGLKDFYIDYKYMYY